MACSIQNHTRRYKKVLTGSYLFGSCELEKMPTENPTVLVCLFVHSLIHSFIYF